MALRYYKLHCEICGYTLVSDGSNVKLTEYKRSKIQKELPKIDLLTQKTVSGTWLTLLKKYKCPKCGRLISARPYKEPELENKTKNNDEQNFNQGSQGSFKGF